jgi:hypothetical protein
VLCLPGKRLFGQTQCCIKLGTFHTVRPSGGCGRVPAKKSSFLRQV